MKRFKNWKTTACGILMAVGMYFSTQGTNERMRQIGDVTIILTPILFGALTKDFNVTGGNRAQTGEAQNRTPRGK